VENHPPIDGRLFAGEPGPGPGRIRARGEFIFSQRVLTGRERIAGAGGGQFLNKTRTRATKKTKTPKKIPSEFQLQIAGWSPGN